MCAGRFHKVKAALIIAMLVGAELRQVQNSIGFNTSLSLKFGRSSSRAVSERTRGNALHVGSNAIVAELTLLEVVIAYLQLQIPAAVFASRLRQATKAESDVCKLAKCACPRFQDQRKRIVEQTDAITADPQSQDHARSFAQQFQAMIVEHVEDQVETLMYDPTVPELGKSVSQQIGAIKAGAKLPFPADQESTTFQKHFNAPTLFRIDLHNHPATVRGQALAKGTGARLASKLVKKEIDNLFVLALKVSQDGLNKTTLGKSSHSRHTFVIDSDDRPVGAAPVKKEKANATANRELVKKRTLQWCLTIIITAMLAALLTTPFWMRQILYRVTFAKYKAFSTTCAMLAIIISVFHLSMHIYSRFFHRKNRTQTQRDCIIVILALVPLYACDTWACLSILGRETQQSNHRNWALPQVLTTVREIYEPFVIVAFINLLLSWLGGAEEVAEAFQRQSQAPQHVWITILKRMPSFKVKDALVKNLQTAIPMPFYPGYNLVSGMLYGILQFSAVAMCTCLSEFVIWMMCGCNAEKLRKYAKVPEFLKAVSVFFAMYSLFLFYLEVDRNKELAARFHEIHPEHKFICVKAVIFLTILQKFVCETVLPFFSFWSDWGGPNWFPDEKEYAAQNILLACELVVFALWHFAAYPFNEFDKKSSHSKASIGSKDVASPMKMLRDIFRLGRREKRQRKWLRSIHRNATADELSRCFNLFDKDRSGYINKEKLEFMLRATGHSDGEIIPLLCRIMKDCDADNDGIVSRDEFLAGMRPVMIPGRHPENFP